MTISLTVKMLHKTTRTDALLDCGATHNFIDPRTITSLSMGTRELRTPLNVHNVDGTNNQGGTITQFCNLWIRRGTHVEKLGFYVANLGRDRIILGYPWFKVFNPSFDWTTNALRGEDVTIETAGYHHRHPTLLPPIQPSEIHELTQKVEATMEEDRQAVQKLIPARYHRHWEVFSERASYRFPPAREEDHAIVLKPGAPTTIDCRVYRQTEAELEGTRQFITEALAKGYITDSKSPYASGLFYRAKKDGKLRPIMDYRMLNRWTIRDTYPLPLIGNILDHLQGKTLFTKFDIRWGYNNIRIKEEDRWKAAFKTPFGLYEPTVMYFGLTNSPATFCRAMKKMLRPLLLKYHNNLFDYIDDVLIATRNNLELHQQITDDVLDLFARESYFLRPSKCEFEKTRIEYLGLVVDGDKLTIDPKKADGLHNWPRELKTVKEVRSVLGVLGYQRPFIPHYADIARPLTTLTKKTHPFQWTPECRKALDTLIKIVTDGPELAQPDLVKPFYLQVDASAYATGAVLTQLDGRGKHRAIGFFSKTFNEAERNYDIHDRELLAVFRGLTHWRHLLLSSPFETTVLTDHKNLEYYREPHHINRRIARYVQRLQDYNFIIKHIPGDSNKADALSRRPDYDKGTNDNMDVTVLPPQLFVQSTTLACLFPRAATLSSIDERVRAHQLKQNPLLRRWATTYPLKQEGELHWYGERLVVVENDSLRRGVISLYHDSPTAGHPGITNTTRAIARDYWWPALKRDVTEFVQGCTMCQSRKNQPNRAKPPLFPLSSEAYSNPFTSIAMDFIVKLPLSDTYDTILTITDTFSKASIFIPCNETIDATNTAKLYATYVLPHYGLPTRIISDRDPRFTSTFTRELCRALSIDQNISTAYHPQTDGQSERTNQRLEQYLRIFIDYHQNNWASLLPLAQYALNAWPNATTGKPPFEILMGYVPRVHQTMRPFKSPTLEQRLTTLKQTKQETTEALKKAADLQLPSRFEPYQVGDKVWLEGRNLTTTHPTAKLAPRRYGPFPITRVISRTSYQLKLPPQWKIHNVFHATLLTRYKETALNGRSYQEPAPDLIEGQLEWEVERILRVRRRRNQLQYLVRWKGFSEAHDSWEPVTNLHADQLIQNFYKSHPTATGNPSPRSIVIQHIAMSTPSSPIIPPTEEPALTYPSSPQPLMIPPRLEDRIEDPPAPLTLEERLEDPVPAEALLMVRDPTPPMRPQTPEGYVHYDPADPNHVRYVRKIHLHREPYDTPQLPHYVRFEHDMGMHQHYAYGLMNDDGPQGTPYGWPIEAKVFTGPIPHLDVSIHNDSLGIFDARYAKSLEVDASLYAVRDYGVLADVDKYRIKMLDYEDLLTRQAQLDKDKQRWRDTITPIRKRLVASQACRRVHPYLQGLLPIPKPPRYITTDAEIHQHPTMSLREAIIIDAAAGIDEAARPWYHGTLGRTFSFSDHPTPRCPYCRTVGHTLQHCPDPHVRCRLAISCIIPTGHRNYGTNCPYANIHLTDNHNEEGYVGHEDEEPNAEA